MVTAQGNHGGFLLHQPVDFLLNPLEGFLEVEGIDPHIAHIHTAGNPGRGELDEKQEINYPAVMQALLDVGYKGFVGQEFIPTGDPLQGLSQAVAVCDV